MQPTPEEKYQQLLVKKKDVEEKLKNLYLNFRGIRHESSADEMKYTQIKVYESYLESINAELKVLEESGQVEVLEDQEKVN